MKDASATSGGSTSKGRLFWNLGLAGLVLGVAASALLLNIRSHAAIEADSAQILTDSVKVGVTQEGALELVALKQGDQVHAGELIAEIKNSSLLQRYSELQAELQSARKVDTAAQPTIIPPHLSGSIFHAPPPRIPSPLPPANPVGNPQPASAPPDTPSPITQKRREKVVLAQRVYDQCAATQQAIQSGLDDLKESAQATNKAPTSLQTEVDLARAQRDKFFSLYTDGIISRAELQVKDQALVAAQKKLEIAQQRTTSVDDQVKAKQEDLDSANRALQAAKLNLAKAQSDLASANTDPHAPPPPAVAPQPEKPVQRKRPFIPKFGVAAPPIAPLGVAFSPDKHVESQILIDEATRKLKLVTDAIRLCRVTAPCDGVVENVMLKPGQQVSPGAVLCYLEKPQSQRIVAEFSHEHALRIRYGESCTIRFDSIPKAQFRGQIARFIDSGDATHPAKAEVLMRDSPQILATLRSGSAVHVSVLPSQN